MMKRKSEIWEHFEIVGKKSTCKYCHKEAFKNPSRMPVHLLKCKECPDEVKSRLANHIPKSCISLCKKIPEHLAKLCSDRTYEQIANIKILNNDDLVEKVYLEESSWAETMVKNKSYIKPDEEEISDEFSAFGHIVANKLRCIGNPQARTIAQYYINTILFRAEMTNFQDHIDVPSPKEFTMFDALRKDPICEVIIEDQKSDVK